jgi:hypothetical protein
LFLCLFFLMAPCLAAQDTSLQVGAGFGVRDPNWDGEPWQPVDAGSGHLTYTGQLGLTTTIATSHRVRFLASVLMGDLANQQASLDYQYSVLRWNEREVYVYAGLSLNFVSGTYRFHMGYKPPRGEGDYRYIDQRWRPGVKLGAGFQWTKNWAVELDGHLVHLDTSGFQSAPRTTTWYAAILMSYHLPVKH